MIGVTESARRPDRNRAGAFSGPRGTNGGYARDEAPRPTHVVMIDCSTNWESNP